MDKKKTIKIASIVLVIILVSLAVLGVTQAYYSSTAYSPKVNEYSTGILSITSEAKTDSISLEDALPITDEEALDKDPYVFAIKNVGNVDYKFNIKLLSTSENTIDPQYIKLKVNEEDIKVLSSCDNSIIMEDVVLKAGETIDIKLWVWLSKENPATPNTEIGKEFTSKIVADGQAIYTTSNNGGSLTAAQYITNLYTNANKQEVENNGIMYHTARGVSLMNDRLGGTTEDLDGGNIRYYGATPNNYVWLGDTYTEDMTIEGNITADGYDSKEACIEDGNSIAYCTDDVEVHAGDKKLWRIIGVFDGKLKLVTDNIICTQGLSWDTSASTVNGGYGINEWSQSDLMKLLNPGYSEESVNNSLYWTKGSGKVYTGNNNATKSNISFASTGLSASEKNMIDEAVWYTGAYDNYSYADVHYKAERQNMGKICSSTGTYGAYCNDTVERTNEWLGKVGLISASDYGYSVDLNSCNRTLSAYSYTECANNNWLVNGRWYWTMSPRAYSSNPLSVFAVDDDGNLYNDIANYDASVRPAVYLKSGVTISSGNGSQSDPYELRYQ